MSDESGYRVPTIRVLRRDGQGSHLINLADYDPRIHTKVDAHEAVPAVKFPDEVKAEVEAGDVFDKMTDPELRRFIKDRTGKAPHGLSRRKALLSLAREA